MEISFNDVVTWPASRHGILFVSVTDCEPCITMDRTLEELVTKINSQPRIYKVVVDKSDKRAVGKAILFGISTFPWLKFVGPEGEAVVSDFEEGEESVIARFREAAEQTFGRQQREVP